MTVDRVDDAAPVVVIGAGQAGFSAAVKLRDLGHEGPITLVGSEDHPPYQRPPLSKAYLLGGMTRERLYFRPPDFFRQKAIDLRPGSHVKRIDRRARRVELADGTFLPYAHLVLATGARPRRLPESMGGHLTGVYYLRTLSDIDAMAPEFRPGRRVLIIGGGYIGLEAAAVSAKIGLEVTVIEAAPRILQRVASAETSAYFRQLHRAHNVDLREGTALVSLAGTNGRVEAAKFGDGTDLRIDFVIAGVGVHPNVELAEEAGLETENGIKVDLHCRTSDPAILAAGDCSSFPWRGRRIRLECVGNAIDQGEAAAATIMGSSCGYEAHPWFWSDQFDVKLQIAGLSEGYNSVVTRPGRGDAKSFWYFRDGELLAVDAINDPRAFMSGKQLLKIGKSPSPEAISDPATDLKTLHDNCSARNASVVS